MGEWYDLANAVKRSESVVSRGRVLPRVKVLSLSPILVLKIALILAVVIAGLSLPFLIASWTGPLRAKVMELKAANERLHERLDRLEIRFELLKSELPLKDPIDK